MSHCSHTSAIPGQQNNSAMTQSLQRSAVSYNRNFYSL